MNPSREAALRAALAPRRPKQIQPVMKPDVPEPWVKADAYAVVDARSGGRCECQKPMGGQCDARAETHHHIAGRNGPDPHHPDNLLHLNEAHHRRIHAHPRQSCRDGTMRSRLAAS